LGATGERIFKLGIAGLRLEAASGALLALALLSWVSFSVRTGTSAAVAVETAAGVAAAVATG
jgi:hypothetical protein